MVVRKLIVAVALVLSLATTAVAESRYTGEYAAQHLSHYAIGGIAGGLTAHYYPKDWNQDYKVLTAIAVPLAVGLVAETIFDGSNGTWDILDVLEYGAGGAGVVLMYTWKF